MTAAGLLPSVGSTLDGVLSLRRAAFVDVAAMSADARAAAVAVVLLAGLSEGVAQSIVLFANKVKPARMLLSCATGALLFCFGYAFLVLSTWAVCRLPAAPHLPLGELAVVFAASYAPLLFAFLGAMPYLGPGILAVLRVWHFLALAVGVAAVGGVGIFVAAACVGVGWAVMVLAQRSFGKPIVALGAMLLDAVAGVKLVDDERLVVGRAVAAETTAQPVPAAAMPAPSRASTAANVWRVALGLCGVAVLALAVALALDPVRQTLFGWQTHAPAIVSLAADLLWLGILAFVVSAMMAPLETLGWWAGWYGDTIDDAAGAVVADVPAALDETAARYTIYLDGIAQSSSRYTPDIETFLDALAPELPAGVRLIRGLMVYSVMNRPLEDDPLWSRLWAFVDAARSGSSGASAARAALGMIVNLRNVMIVAVSADARYGPMYNFGIAYVMYRSLLAHGYRLGSGTPVTLIGYSGGAQMACGSAAFLRDAIEAPIEVISLGGVISGDDPILELERLYHFVGDKDAIERIGPVMFPSRWGIAVRSSWNVAKRLGRLLEISLGPVGHQVPGGMLDPDTRLPDGRSSLRQTLDYIRTILAGGGQAAQLEHETHLPQERDVVGEQVAEEGDRREQNG